MIEVRHSWAATAGPSPARTGYCPLGEGHDESIRAMASMRRGLGEGATDFQMVLASMAWRIPQDQTTLWFQLTAHAATSWRPASPHDDIDQVTTKALARLTADRRVLVTGDHPGKEHTSPRTARRQLAGAWIATPTGADPNDPGIYPLDLHHAGDPGATYYQALDAYHAHRQDLINADMHDAVGPEHDFTLWWRLQLDAATTWMPEDAHTDPRAWALGLLET